ncbi:MAG TPA: cyclic nucleotide-binding domain-containing protein [Candidatus Binatia bacterium]|jgi:CRP/FNR family cyclic AMP-dependent transcriptional regulator|nr:cyclic nucleotide-binding domain-containing protein [Candidatus Binatia bacterium]
MKSPFNFFSGSADEQRIQELKGLTLFNGLRARELRELDELLHARSYQKDEVIFDEGDTGLGLFIVVRGRVKIVSSHAGLKRLAPEFGRGDFFGELALFDEAKRTARAVAIEPTEIVALFRTEFFSLLERDRGIAAKILYELSRTVCRRSRSLVVQEEHLPLL